MTKFRSKTMLSLCRIGGSKQVSYCAARGCVTSNHVPACQSCYAGDFIVDDDGMGYADIGEEEDWGRSDKKAANVTDGPTTSKRRKDGSTAGQQAHL